jgi:hypothetical protein
MLILQALCYGNYSTLVSHTRVVFSGQHRDAIDGRAFPIEHSDSRLAADKRAILFSF